MAEKINYTAIVEEIRDIFLDDRTHVEYSEDRDEDGVHVNWELDSTQAQEDEVVELLRKFLMEQMQILINDIFATEDAKKVHCE